MGDPRLRCPAVAGLACLIALVGPSRVIEGHHWMTDVVGSYLVGLAYLLGLLRVHRWLRERWSRSLGSSRWAVPRRRAAGGRDRDIDCDIDRVIT